MCVTVNRHVTENGHNECDFIVSRFLYIAEDKSSLYWHKDASNKFIVKRQPGPYTLSSTSTTTTTESPMVKIVRYDPGDEEVRKIAIWSFYESTSRLTLGYSNQTCKWQQESWWSYHEVRDLVKTLPGMRTMAGWFFVCDSNFSSVTSSQDVQSPSEQTQKFLPVQVGGSQWKLAVRLWWFVLIMKLFQVGNKRFPLPDSDKLAGKTVKSVVLVLPQNYKLKWVKSVNIGDIKL